MTVAGRRSALAAGLLTLGSAVVWASACGYRAVGAPAAVAGASIHVAPPALAPSISALALAGALRRALSAELARRGVVLSAHRAGADLLRCRVLALAHPRVAVARGRVAARTARIRLELQLTDRAGQTTWRSGHVEAELTRARPAEALRAEELERWILSRLARRAAALAIERLVDARRSDQRGSRRQ